ncbi:hypothetical protein [Pseudoalteromonas umbrosa]|uniref:hypothetical protein n=1 Tax=Pseudoalteromonas umbrosa TaxID=3048489 RepID=UPI0024C348D8|nr:hypothetical protein [Pseudoalteromonas sp. B95]MDK1286329.1 hypothetical protein [Pseudoalteromonas sp. B95]
MKVLIFLLIVFFGTYTHPSVYDLNETMKLIADTEASAPNSVRGVFQFEIKAGAKRGDVVYLNTQEDYRDRRNVTLALSWYAVSKMTKKYGQRPEVFFINKKVEVVGEASRKKIPLYRQDGTASEAYYYQTHINVYSDVLLTLM